MRIVYRRGREWCECGELDCTAMASVALPDFDLPGLRYATCVVAALLSHRSGGVSSPPDPRRGR